MKIGLLGYGVVGQHVDKILQEKNAKHQVEYILKRTKIDDERYQSDIATILEDETIDVVMECMGGLEPAYQYVRQALLHHKHVISANKKMLAHYFWDLFFLAKQNHVRLLFEASVGGGIPCIQTVKQLAKSNTLTKISGILNGTSNYILSSLFESDLTFAKALENAQRLGYAESDPTDDICGFDTANKCVLACVAGFQTYIDIQQVVVFGIQNLTQEMVMYAKEHNATIKLIGNCIRKENGFHVYVIPTLIPNTHQIAKVSKNLNIVHIEGDNIGALQLIGQGAGGRPTAVSMIDDLDHVVDEQEDVTKGMWMDEQHEFIVDTCGETIAQEYISSSLGNHLVKLKKMTLLELKKICSEKMFVVEVYND